MDQVRAVREFMVLDIKTNPSIPSECYSAIERGLNLMYVVGWESQSLQGGNHNAKTVYQYNKFDKLLHTYSSVSEAARQLHYDRIGLLRAIKRGDITKQGHMWSYTLK